MGRAGVGGAEEGGGGGAEEGFVSCCFVGGVGWGGD